VSERTALLKYDAARHALAEAHAVDEVKDIRDKAVAMQVYAMQAKDTTLIAQATEIRIRAERRAGELLVQMGERGERRAQGKGDGKGRSVPPLPKLSDLGINKTQSSRWQQLAALDDQTFETKVAGASKRAYDSMTGRFLKAERIKKAKAKHEKRIEDGCTVDDLIALAETGYRASVILADPPWPWETWGGDSGKILSAPDNHYGTSTLDQIARLPVAALAADDCALLLWCTGPHTTIGSHVKIIEAWGFKPSTIAFIWVKENKGDGRVRTRGQGYWTLANAEVVFIATKGSPLRLATDVHQVVLAPVGEHSAKPEEVRCRIERLFPGPYLELYGRKLVPGWTVWGNEIARGDMSIAEAAE
jgi:N6-adenosine-specific RNA methylase IME4